MKQNPTYSVKLASGLIISAFFVITNIIHVRAVSGSTFDLPAAGPVIVDTMDYELRGYASGVQFFRDGIIILSNSRYNQKMVADHVAFGQDATYLVRDGNLESYNNKTFINANPFPVNPVGLAFSSDYKIMYFTAPDETNRGTEKIYSVPLDNSRNTAQASINQTDIKVMTFCTGRDNYRHPALSSDNTIMIFASDKAGGSGGYDLFMVKHDGSKWSDPVNLGKSINSAEDELYPFIDKENNLFFSSEGHSGFGGFDIYMCKYLDGGWGSPVNLMKSINSEFDDIALKIDPENHYGFFTTVNKGSKKDKQLYRISLQKPGDLAEAMFDQTRSEYKTLFDEGSPQASETRVTTPVVAGAVAGQKESSAGEAAAATGQGQAATQTVSSGPGTSSGGTAAAAAGTAASTTATTAALAAGSQDSKKETAPARQENVQEQQVVKPVEPVAEPVKQEEAKDEVIFRVQISSASSKKSDYRVTVDGKSYPTFVYSYKGAYRYCVGEFRTVAEANSFKNKCRSSGFDQAFVAAFINDERVTDPAYFK